MILPLKGNEDPFQDLAAFPLQAYIDILYNDVLYILLQQFREVPHIEYI